MTIQALEQDLLARLEPLRSPTVSIQLMPDSAATVGQMVLAATGITIVWNKGESLIDTDSSGLIKSWPLIFIIDFRFKNRTGLLAAIKAVVDKLHNYKPANSLEKLRILEQRSLGREPNTNYWAAELEIKAIAHLLPSDEDFPLEDNLPVLEEVNFGDDYGGASTANVGEEIQ